MDFKEFLHAAASCTVGGTVFSCVFDSGFFRTEQMTSEPHLHMSYEVHCAVNGACRMQLYEPRAEVRISAGEVLLIPPGCCHSVLSADADCRKFSFFFSAEKRQKQSDGRVPEDFFRAVLPEAGAQPVCVRVPGCAEILFSLQKELVSGGFGADDLISAELCRFCTRLLRALSAQAPGDAVQAEEEVRDRNLYAADASIAAGGAFLPRGDRLDCKDSISARQAKMLLYLDRNYAHPVSERALAESLNLSVRQVSRLFRMYYGRSFCETLTDIRLFHAEKLLVCTDASAEDIACRVGYHAPSAFFCAFRKKFGMTPGAYRKSVPESDTKPSDSGHNPQKDGASET